MLASFKKAAVSARSPPLVNPCSPKYVTETISSLHNDPFIFYIKVDGGLELCFIVLLYTVFWLSEYGGMCNRHVSMCLSKNYVYCISRIIIYVLKEYVCYC